MRPGRQKRIGFSGIGIALLGAAIVAGCGQGPDQNNNQAAPSQTSEASAPAQPAVRALPIEEQRTLAFKAAFGGEKASVVEVGDERLRYSPGKLVWIGDRAVLLSPGENLDECHACTGALAIHYLAPAENGFRVTASWPALVRGSGWGAPPTDWSLSDKFADDPVLVDKGSYTAQGCTTGAVTLTELRPDGPVQSGPVPILYSNQSGFGPDNGVRIDGKIVNINKGASFDVAYSGSRDFTETWARQGDTFKLRGGETRMPTC